MHDVAVRGQPQVPVFTFKFLETRSPLFITEYAKTIGMEASRVFCLHLPPFEDTGVTDIHYLAWSLTGSEDSDSGQAFVTNALPGPYTQAYLF